MRLSGTEELTADLLVTEAGIWPYLGCISPDISEAFNMLGTPKYWAQIWSLIPGLLLNLQCP